MGVTTDTTNTDNTLYYAGEAFRLAYDIGEGVGTRRVQTDLSGQTIEISAIRVDVTGGDISTATPSTGATAISASAVVVAAGVTNEGVITKIPTNNNLGLTTVGGAKENNLDTSGGKFSVFIPSSLLSEVQYTSGEEPVPGAPIYVAYTVSYMESGSGSQLEKRVIETDVLGFRWTPTFNIT